MSSASKNCDGKDVKFDGACGSMARLRLLREDEAKGVHVNEADPILAILQPGRFF